MIFFLELDKGLIKAESFFIFLSCTVDSQNDFFFFRRDRTGKDLTTRVLQPKTGGGPNYRAERPLPPAKRLASKT